MRCRFTTSLLISDNAYAPSIDPFQMTQAIDSAPTACTSYRYCDVGRDCFGVLERAGFERTRSQGGCRRAAPSHFKALTRLTERSATRSTHVRLRTLRWVAPA